MYEVLIKGMQIKLILGSDRDIPIEEVLIYLTKIPLKEGNVLEEEMRVLKEINKLASEFKKMKLGMSVFEMIRNRDAVLMKAIKHEIDTEKIN
jgi:cobalamin biosynthesis Co2+ chelatase CbiK